jgi:glutathione synthase/RimK-type ligase-like ATP-grasp enzyme
VIGLATSREHPELSGGEKLLFEELVRRGIAAKIVLWDEENTWRDCSEIVIRCTWDYSSRLPEFLKWIDEVERAGIRLHNSPDIIRWNSDKHYLRDLELRGIKIPHTVWFPRGGDLIKFLKENVRGDQIIKPTVSAGAYNTHRVSPETIEEVAASLEKVAREKDLMLQEYMPEIESPGEYSLVFFRNEFSHAVLKTPAQGDFRVQPRYGGQQIGVEVSEEMIAQARDILTKILFDDAPLYARVDGIGRDSEFILMELELIEPYLFLEFQERAVILLSNSIEAVE